jgi:hypothetical protein
MMLSKPGGEGTFFGPAKAALAKKPRQGDEVGVDATYDVVALKLQQILRPDRLCRRRRVEGKRRL